MNRKTFKQFLKQQVANILLGIYNLTLMFIIDFTGWSAVVLWLMQAPLYVGIRWTLSRNIFVLKASRVKEMAEGCIVPGGFDTLKFEVMLKKEGMR